MQSCKQWSRTILISNGKPGMPEGQMPCVCFPAQLHYITAKEYIAQCLNSKSHRILSAYWYSDVALVPCEWNMAKNCKTQPVGSQYESKWSTVQTTFWHILRIRIPRPGEVQQNCIGPAYRYKYRRRQRVCRSSGGLGAVRWLLRLFWGPKTPLLIFALVLA